MASPEARRCAYFVQKRGRNCRMLAAKGSVYCGEHLIHDTSQVTDVRKSSDKARRRVPCPLDPSHTVFEDTLPKHLKKCNAAKKPRPLCYSPRVNTGLVDYQPSEEEKLPLSAFSTERIQALIKRVKTAYNEHFTEIETQVLSHPVMEKELTDPKNGATALKHLQQQSSILAHLDSLGILAHEDMYYIEFGAGRGKLSQCIQKAFQRSSCRTAKERDHTTGSESEMESVPTSHELSNVHYVLVDRDSCRHKVDGFHRASALVGAYYHRLLMDIEHLDLGKLDCLNEGLNVKNVAAVSKHLCGAATDLSLRCIVQTFLQKADEVSRERQISEAGPDCRMNSKLCGIVIALCCHHRCSWPQLAGRKFFEKLGFSPVDFHLVCHMSSWAVCGVRPPPKSSPGESKMQTEHADQIEPVDTTDDVEAMAECEKEDKEEENMAQASQKENIGRTRRWGYVPHPNEEIGLQCKRLIDLARLSYLRENGLRAWLVYYVDRSTSLENVLLVALPTK